ncbi:hypothetical protein [Kitasatospora sp. NPDC017646]|uniref:hypothetical protein n=1 Tax=Kitasatospora sp. NPDC017646 TaxID=3364024 RepID=UPI0037AF9485
MRRNARGDDQLHALADHAAALGPAAHYLLDVEWPQLYRRAEALRTAGTDPADPRVRRVAARLDELCRLFSGGDTALSAAGRTAWRRDPVALSGDPGAPGRRLGPAARLPRPGPRGVAMTTAVPRLIRLRVSLPSALPVLAASAVFLPPLAPAGPLPRPLLPSVAPAQGVRARLVLHRLGRARAGRPAGG